MPVSLSIIWNQPYPKLKTKIYVMGDFNLNLLNYETHTHTNDFVNSMVYHCLIPHILQPTRVTDHSATATDNIFPNVADYETATGNIKSGGRSLFTVSDSQKSTSQVQVQGQCLLHL